MNFDSFDFVIRSIPNGFINRRVIPVNTQTSVHFDMSQTSAFTAACLRHNVHVVIDAQAVETIERTIDFCDQCLDGKPAVAQKPFGLVDIANQLGSCQIRPDPFEDFIDTLDIEEES